VMPSALRTPLPGFNSFFNWAPMVLPFAGPADWKPQKKTAVGKNGRAYNPVAGRVLTPWRLILGICT
jgi:hypothetical protein